MESSFCSLSVPRLGLLDWISSQLCYDHTMPKRMDLRINRGPSWRDLGYAFGPVSFFFGLQELIKSMRVMKTRKCIALSFPSVTFRLLSCLIHGDSLLKIPNT